MVRLIDADALIESLTINPTECMGCPEPEWIDELIQILDTAPSVLINCIQCKNYYETEDDNGVVGHCKMDTAHAVERSTAYMHDDLYEVTSIRIPLADKPSGKWKYLHGSIGSYMTIHCPFCGTTFNDVAEWKYNYCPNCGAKMVKGVDTK